MKVLTPHEAVKRIPSGATVVPGGFGSCGHPDLFTIELEKRFLKTGEPTDLTLLFASGAGGKNGMGLDKLAHPNLVSRAIGGFWSLCPKLRALGEEGILEAHNWPQGVISKLFSVIAEGGPGVLSPVGLHTFVDPLQEGGVFLPGRTIPLVERHTFKGQNYLYYPSRKIDVALLRGTVADEHGNISLRGEASRMDALSQAQAARNSGGEIFVQVKEVISGTLHSTSVDIPGHLVDFVVVSGGENHPFTYATESCPSHIPEVTVSIDGSRRSIVNRALKELPPGDYRQQVVNFGIGIPSEVGSSMSAAQRSSYTLTIESGVLGGTPLSGNSFGAAVQPEAILDQSQLFTFYDGGGIDKAFLGFAQVDSAGRVNVSKFSRYRPGAGGFINITASAKEIYFCGTFLTGHDTQSGLSVNSQNYKFVGAVEQVTFDPRASSAERVLVITEVGVFEIKDGGLVLKEIAEGYTLSDIRQMSRATFSTDCSLVRLSA